MAAEGEEVVVHAEAVEDGGVEVADVDGVLDDIVGVVVGDENGNDLTSIAVLIREVILTFEVLVPAEVAESGEMEVNGLLIIFV